MPNKKPSKSGQSGANKQSARATEDGPRSPDRSEPTSASPQDNPVGRVPRPAKAGKVAAAELRRAAGRPQPDEGLDVPADLAIAPEWAQQSERLTTAGGTRVADADNSLSAGERGPTLLEDFHLRERIMHFDHERIPERVVHTRGAGAYGTFVATEGLDDVCRAAFLRRGESTPVFVRFSTVAGSRGSADTVRDVRGFATKFYTSEGNFDLVGNNIPVFFIQDGLKFPDFIHTVKPEPDREIPQAQSAHDTFWDFVSLQPESTHMLLWAMSDRAIPRSYATMEGFGVHTFRLVATDGSTVLVKWHWKPVAGVHGLVWEEAQKLGGIDPDFHRRDLHARIAAGNAPQWELAVQVMPDTSDETFEGIDLLDPTKLVPEELCPVRTVGVLTLDRNPTNFFAETEQVAFHPGHVVPGIDFVDDPLLHARLFSYLDTQLTRLGGPNFNQIPVNRPLAPVNDNNRDGFMQQAVHEGVAPYTPNSLGGGCPFAALDSTAFEHVPREVAGPKVKLRPASFDDYFSQATMFYRSLSPVEQEHVAGAFSFELGKCVSPGIRLRMLERLAQVDGDLTATVAAHLGLEPPKGDTIDPQVLSPALAMVDDVDHPVDGRIVAVYVDDDTPTRLVAACRSSADDAGVEIVVIGPRFGATAAGVAVDRSIHITDSVEYDALVITAVPDETIALHATEAYRHHKALAVLGNASSDALGLGDDPDVLGSIDDVLAALARHRSWAR